MTFNLPVPCLNWSEGAIKPINVDFLPKRGDGNVTVIFARSNLSEKSTLESFLFEENNADCILSKYWLDVWKSPSTRALSLWSTPVWHWFRSFLRRKIILITVKITLIQLFPFVCWRSKGWCRSGRPCRPLINPNLEQLHKDANVFVLFVLRALWSESKREKRGEKECERENERCLGVESHSILFAGLVLSWPRTATTIPTHLNRSQGNLHRDFCWRPWLRTDRKWPITRILFCLLVRKHCGTF